MAPLRAPWRNGKTERSGKDWKEDYYKMTQDGPEAQTWTDFEDDCDAVNQARASKIKDSGYSTYQRVFGKSLAPMEDAVLECGGRPWRSEPGADRRLGTGTVDDYGTHCPTSQAWHWITNVDGNEPCTTTLRNTTRANCTLDNLCGFGDVERTQKKKNLPALFGTWV